MFAREHSICSIEDGTTDELKELLPMSEQWQGHWALDHGIRLKCGPPGFLEPNLRLQILDGMMCCWRPQSRNGTTQAFAALNSDFEFAELRVKWWSRSVI